MVCSLPPGTVALERYLSGQSMQSMQRALSNRQDQHGDAEKGELKSTFDPFDANGKFDFERYLQTMFERADQADILHRRMGLGFSNLTVTGVGSGFGLQDTVPSLFTEVLRLPQHIASFFHPPVKQIVRDLEGCVKPGEMLLVLGRPGAGCTSFLKTVASYRDGFRSIEGDIVYEGFDHKKIETLFRGDVVYEPEDDVHFPTLTVDQTLAFAAATRAPQAKRRMDLEAVGASRSSYINLVKEVLGTILGLRHTFNTLVGNELIRGVSGGEKKRVSIAETLATRAKITCYDNSSRGLDSSTALEFVQALRIATDIGDLTTLCCLYQAGEHLAKIFDKVIVLNEGRMVYFGPFSEAASHFKQMGYEPQPRQTTADFLVACTDVHGRRIQEGMESRAPKTADEQAAYFKQSDAGKRNHEEVRAYIDEMNSNNTDDYNRTYKQSARAEKAKHVPKGSRFLLSWAQQIRLCIKRRAQILWGDKATTIVLTCAAIFQSLIIGSTFYQMPKTTAGFFPRGGVLFFVLLYQSFMAVAEVTTSYAQRPIVIRQKRFAMCSPSADALANTLLSIPVSLITLTTFVIVVYFLTGLGYTADQFFILWAITALTTFGMVATFRALAAIFRQESVATLCSGLIIIASALYTGYVIPRTSMKIWWKWLSYAQPLPYSFEILMANEFRKLNVPCAQLVPSGPGFANVALANQVCAIAGAQPGQSVISGSDYVAISYGYYWSNRGRNVGILFAFFIFSVAVYALASELQSDPAAAGGVMIFKRSAAPKEVLEASHARGDVESGDDKGDGEKEVLPETDSNDQQEEAVAALEVSKDVFTWQHVNYDVFIKGDTRRLLNDVSGYVKPGKLTALMGESGAGKTTLLNVLAQRVGTGVIGGEFKVAGRPLPRSFEASTGYCQQADVHLSTASVREALRFSAVLRQPAEVPLAEKYEYVEQVIHMLEMDSWAEAIVGDVGMGLNVEQRKRLTIAVELAAKPKLLLFLDEPTSGLDAQAAWSIVRFLRKLADHGQAILCTIHQPSGELFGQFDRLLLLQKGGKTVFFGDLGEKSTKVVKYFESRSGKKCAEEDNPAEYILDVIGAGATAQTDKDWNQLFKESELQRDLDQELDSLLSTPAGNLSAEDEARGNREYAASPMTQLSALLKRTWNHYMRNPTYIMSKIGLNVIGGLFIGSTFYKNGSQTSVFALQNMLFSVFMTLVLCTSLAQQMQPQFLDLRGLFEAREKPSKMYHWSVLVITFLIVEIPWNILAGTLYWLPWYFLVRFNPGDAARAALSWFYVAIEFQAYWVTFALAIAALAPNAMLASILFSTAFSFVVTFCPVLQPPALLPDFWGSFMPVLTPFTYLVESLMGLALADRPIRCLPTELNTLIPPNGSTCDAFLSGFSSSLDMAPVGNGYYVSNPDGTCGYCQYREASSYLTGLSARALVLDPNHRYRNIGIVAAYCGFNLLICFAAFYLFRIATFHRKSKVGSVAKAGEEKAEEVVTATSATAKGPQIQVENSKTSGVPAPDVLNAPGGGVAHQQPTASRT